MSSDKAFHVDPINKHRFTGRVQCLDGFYYAVTADGCCSGCKAKLWAEGDPND